MFRYYILLIFILVASELSSSGVNLESCTTRSCIQKIEKASRKALKIDWKPISVFPEEAKRFQ